MKRFIISICFLLVVLCAFAHCEDAAPAVAAVPIDPITELVNWLATFIPVKYIGAITSIATAISLIASAAVYAVKLFAPGSKIVFIIDLIGHWAALVGVSARRDQVVEAAPVPPAPNPVKG
jgi:hypothetical protein